MYCVIEMYCYELKCDTFVSNGHFTSANNRNDEVACDMSKMLRNTFIEIRRRTFQGRNDVTF